MAKRRHPPVDFAPDYDDEPEQEPVKLPDPPKLFIATLVDPDTGEIVDEINVSREDFEMIKILR